MDPLSDVLSLVKPRSYVSGGFDMGGDWSIQFGAHEGIKCYAVVSGTCWLAVEAAEPVRLNAGDCFLLPRGRAFRLTSDLALPPTPFETLRGPGRNGGVLSHNGGGGCFIAGSFFLLDGAPASILLSALPPVVHVRDESDQAALRWSMERLRQELREAQPGGFLIGQHLAHMMLVQALRRHLTESTGGVGWLFALADKRMAAAISAIHGNPAQGWSVQALAAAAGMSRSSFAQTFKEMTGAAPMEYLTRWRMLLAGDRLKNSRDPISTIARSLGYESESAFSTAFKRVMGCSPRHYSRNGKSASPSDANGGQAHQLARA